MFNNNSLINYQENKKTFKINFVLIIVLIIIIGCIVFSIVRSKNTIKEISVTNESLTNLVQQINNNSQTASNIHISEAKSSVTSNSNPNLETNNNSTSISSPVSISKATLPDHNITEIKSYFLPEQIENPQSVIKSIYTSNEKNIYLTFDDGPSTTVTPSILETLKKYNVKATFFLLGKNIDSYPEIVKQEFEEGHYLANHGYTHKYSEIYATPENVYAEFEKTEQSIKTAINNQNYNSYLFRFPGGSSGGPHENVKAQARQLFAEKGIAHTNWNCLTSDAAGAKTKEAMMDSLIKSAGNQDSLIVLMHDAQDKKLTAELLPEIIEYYQNLGYEFKNFYDIFK